MDAPDRHYGQTDNRSNGRVSVRLCLRRSLTLSTVDNYRTRVRLIHAPAVIAVVITIIIIHGPFNGDVLQFLGELGSWQLVNTTGHVRALSFLFQRISVAVQRLNSVLLQDGFIDDDRPE